jgi:hypothetical protein
VVFNNTPGAKNTINTENMLAQIMQMVRDQNLRFNKIEQYQNDLTIANG